MSPKSNPKSRRKNCAPKRVVREDAEEKLKSALPQDPMQLAKFIMDHPVTNFFKLPDAPQFAEIVKKAQEEAEEGQEVIFKCNTCKDKVYRSSAGLHYHLMNSCPGMDLHLTCLICGKKLHDSGKMVEHIQDDHVYLHLETPAAETAKRRSARHSILKIQMFAESSSVAEELERTCSSMSDYEEEEMPEEPPQLPSPPKESKRKESSKDPDAVIPRQPRSTTGGTYTSVRSPLAEAFEWTFTVRERLEKHFPLVLPHLQPDTSSWAGVGSEELEETFRLLKQSPSFAVENEFLNSTRTGKRNSKKVITNKANANGNTASKFRKNAPENDLRYQKLDLFESSQTTDDFSCTFFAGGPVWGAAWCPQSCSRGSEEQFLAVCCHFGEHSMEPQNLCQESVLLQIWNCGKLPVRPRSNFKVKPHLAYGLAIDVGPIWGLKWCPLSDSVLGLTPKRQRLGVLAVACADGNARVYALPKPNNTDAPEKGKVYKAPPHIILRPLRSGHFGQCTSVTWSVENGAQFIVAGFASGHIAVWDLKTKSKLLCREEDGRQIRFAFHTFRGHSKPVEDVVFCPFDSNYFVTVGADRFLKLWDLRNTNADLPNFLPPKMSVIYELDWSSLWCGVYASSDSAFSIPYFHGAIFLNLGSSSNTLQNVVPEKSTSWSVSGSDWLNSVASGDVAGNVILNICNNWNRQFISNKSYPRIALYQTEVEWNHQSAATAYLRGDNDEHNFAYSLIFHDCNLIRSMEKWKDTEAHLKVRTFEDFDDECYNLPVGAIHKVRWNPNFASYSWIATATYSGLVRLHCVPGLISAEVEDVWFRHFRS